jgi:hypothetical protein
MARTATQTNALPEADRTSISARVPSVQHRNQTSSTTPSVAVVSRPCTPPRTRAPLPGGEIGQPTAMIPMKMGSDDVPDVLRRIPYLHHLPDRSLFGISWQTVGFPEKTTRSHRPRGRLCGPSLALRPSSSRATVEREKDLHPYRWFLIVPQSKTVINQNNRIRCLD